MIQSVTVTFPVWFARQTEGRHREADSQRALSLDTIQPRALPHGTKCMLRQRTTAWADHRRDRPSTFPCPLAASSQNSYSSFGRVLLGRVKRRALSAAQRLLSKPDQVPRDEAHAKNCLDLAAA